MLHGEADVPRAKAHHTHGQALERQANTIPVTDYSLRQTTTPALGTHDCQYLGNALAESLLGRR